MVFSSVQAYLDPSNWHQHQNHQLIGSNTGNPLLPPQPNPPPQTHGPPGSSPGSIRPGSMAERARLANIGIPEAALKCPRCDSTNTKFCYFNNYSLSQPRHFCKTCRRYWTRGGALRNVPVGGGCRRNKRSKSSSSNKSAASGEHQISNNPVSTSAAVSPSPSTAASASILGLTPPHLPPIRFMSPLSQFTDGFTDVGLNNYTGLTSLVVGSNNDLNTFPSGSFSGGLEPWRVHPHQFPFFGGLDPAAAGMFQFHGGELGFTESTQEVRPKILSSSVLTQLTPVKMEDNRELNVSRQLLGGMPSGNEQWLE